MELMKKKKEKWIEKLDYRSQCVLTLYSEACCYKHYSTAAQYAYRVSAPLGDGERTLKYCASVSTTSSSQQFYYSSTKTMMMIAHDVQTPFILSTMYYDNVAFSK